MSQDEEGESATPLSIRLATAADLATIAKIHKAAYSRGHFTALLSETVLMRYYEAFLSEGTEISLAVDKGAGAVARGFSVYGVGVPEKIAAFKKACAKDILLTSLRHPWLATGKALKAVRGRILNREAYPPADFLLLSIAVARPMGGAGKMLLNDMIAVARQRGHRTVGLYVNADNIRAINAYCATGFRIRELLDGQYYMEAETAA